jgi:hypothetical protein
MDPRVSINVNDVMYIEKQNKKEKKSYYLTFIVST